MNHQEIVDKEEWILTSNNTFIDLDRWQHTINLMGDVCEAPAAFILQYTNKGYQIVIASQSEANPYKSGLTLPPEVNIFCTKVINSQTFLYECHAEASPEWKDNPLTKEGKFNTYLGYPVRWPDGDRFGTCCILDFAVTKYEQKYIDLVGEFAAMVERDLELFVQHTKLEKLSITDELTGLYNRRGFLSLAKKKIALAKRIEQSIIILFCDVDKLKNINDSLGHKIGDMALVKAAMFIKDTIREYDLAARIGGDEFAIFCLTNDQDEVSTIIERLSGSICIGKSNETCFTMSIGQAYVEPNTEYDLEELISRADTDMYQQKRSKE